MTDLAETIEKRIFWQSAEEKYDVTRALLKAIGITEPVDILIGHSAGKQPAHCHMIAHLYSSAYADTCILSE